MNGKDGDGSVRKTGSGHDREQGNKGEKEQGTLPRASVIRVQGGLHYIRGVEGCGQPEHIGVVAAAV